MDDKLNEAYQMAQQMDEQQIDAESDVRDDNINSFLKTIGQIESSGGKNFNHDEIKSGIHKGQRAAGTYGLMPNTAYEVLNRMRRDGEVPQDLAGLSKMDPVQIKQHIETNPDVEQQLASHLAGKVLDDQGNEEKAAYSWFQGHNLSPEDIDRRNYQDHDYVKKYRKYKDTK